MRASETSDTKMKKFEYQQAREEDLSESMAVNESENFAVYSNVEFLYLIGKYVAEGKTTNNDLGLKSLNDYLLILDHNRYNIVEDEYQRRRALALFSVGVILQNNDEFELAEQYLASILDYLSGNPEFASKAKYAKNVIRKIKM